MTANDSSSPPSSRTSRRMLWALVGLAFVIDFVFFTGYYASDDYHYLQGVRSIADGTPYAAYTGSARLGVTLPSAFVYWVTGGSIAACAWFHVAYHLGLVLLASALGRLLDNEWTGVIAAAFVATSPLLYVYAGAVLPDNATSFWLAAALTLIVYAQRRVPLGEGLTAFDRRRFLFHVLAGGLLGLAWMCKETGLIMTVPAALLIMSAGSLRNLAWIQNGAAFTLGFAVVFVIDLVLLRVLAQGWVLRHEFITVATSLFQESMDAQGVTPFARFAVVKTELGLLMPWSMWLLLAGATAYAFLRRRNVGVMAFFWWPLIYLTIGTVSLSAYVALFIQNRYYALLVFPAAVMSACVVSHLVGWWRNSGRAARFHRFVPAVVTLVLAIVAVRELRVNLPSAGEIYRSQEAKSFVAALEVARERYPRQPIVVSNYIWFRMEPLVFQTPNVYPPTAAPSTNPPYLYLEVMRGVDETTTAKLETPLTKVTRLHAVPPPRNRAAVVANAFRSMFGVTRKPRVPAGAIEVATVIFGITPLHDPQSTPQR